MSIVAKNLKDAVLTATLADTTYTTPALTRTRITSATVFNATAGAVSLVVRVLPIAAGTLRTVITRSIAVNETYLCPELINLMLNVGGQVQASGLDMIFTLSGLEITT